MTTGKRFKKKTKDPKAGQCFWRTHGVPIPKMYDSVTVKEYADKHYVLYVIYDNMIFYTEPHFPKGKRSPYATNVKGYPCVILNGTMEKYFKTSSKAVVYLNEILKGFHNEAVDKNIAFHESFDEAERAFIKFDDHDGYYDHHN